jgi:hypothetical protein
MEASLYSQPSQQPPTVLDSAPTSRSQWAVAVVTWLVIVGIAYILTPPFIWLKAQAVWYRLVSDSSYIVMKNQRLQDSLVIPHMRLQKPGYATLILDDFYHSPGNNFSAYSAYLPAGEYVNVPLNFSLEDTYANIDSRIWASGAIAHIVLYQDDGDGRINPTLDSVVKYPNGSVVEGVFTIL